MATVYISSHHRVRKAYANPAKVQIFLTADTYDGGPTSVSGRRSRPMPERLLRTVAQ